MILYKRPGRTGDHADLLVPAGTFCNGQPAVLLNQWYPASLTEVRGFDYEMLRRYGLKNEQEGVQIRAFGNGRYLVTYAFEESPQVTAANITEHVFGRLRVTTVEK
jgi:hypothetical protein